MEKKKNCIGKDQQWMGRTEWMGLIRPIINSIFQFLPMMMSAIGLPPPPSPLPSHPHLPPPYFRHSPLCVFLCSLVCSSHSVPHFWPFLNRFALEICIFMLCTVCICVVVCSLAALPNFVFFFILLLCASPSTAALISCRLE